MKPVHYGMAVLLSSTALAGGAYAQTTPAELEDLVVVAEANRSAATVATRVATSALETPYTIAVLPGKVIEDSAARSLGEALRYVGITGGTDNFGNAGEFFTSRGFQLAAGSNYFRDGLRYRKYGQVPLYDIERIEVLKGPASILYGALEPGGVLNIVSREPSADRSTTLRLRGGGNGYGQLVADTTGGIADGLNYRIQGLYEDADSFRDIVSNTSKGVSSAVEYNSTSRTKIKLSASWFDDRRTGDRGTVLAYKPGGRFVNAAGQTYDFADVPRSRFLGEKFGENHFRDINLTLSVRHQINADWTFRADVVRSDQKEDRTFIWAIADGQIVGANGLLTREIGDWDTRLQGTLGRVELAGEFRAGGITHKLLFGADVERFENNRTNDRYRFSPINIYSPQYLDSRPANGARTVTSPYGGLFESRGAYVQDVAEIGRHFVVLAGVRHDKITDTNTLTGALRQEAEGWTPQFGLVWRPTPYVSPYVSYTRSFVPQTGTDRFGAPFDPQEGEQYEAGVKLDLRQYRSLVSGSVFRLDRLNLTMTDPENPSFKILTGKQRSEGVEFSIATTPIEGLRLNLNYNHLFTAEYVADSAYVGNAMANAAKDAGGLFVSYDLPGEWSDWSLNSGLTHVGKRYATPTNNFYMPAYTLVDIGAAYRLTQTASVSMNVRNLFDETFYTGAINSTTINVGAPRSLIVGLRVRI